MGPIVTEVEDIDKLLSGLETSKLDDTAVLNWLIILPLRIWHPDMSAIVKFEFVKMCPVPYCKRVVDCGTKVGERMIRGCGNDATRARPAALTTTLDKLNGYAHARSAPRST